MSSSEPHVSSLDEKPLAGYQRVSIAAVLALVVGIASALALVHPLLWVLPAVAVVLAIVAVRAIADQDSNLTGRNLALAGMGLALVFGFWAPTRILTRQARLYQQAHAFADEWFELLRTGKLQEAHQLALSHHERQRPGTVLATFYEQSAQTQSQFKQFYSAKPVKTLVALGEGATYEYVGGNGVSPREFITEHIALDYRVHYEEDGRPETMPVRIVLDRDESEPGKFKWRVRSVNDPNRVET